MIRQMILLLFVVFGSVYPTYGQNYLEDGNRCFENGDYECAITNYRLAFSDATGRDKQIAEIKLTQTNSCYLSLKKADNAFRNKNYSLAKREYEKVLDFNPLDVYSKTQLEKCDGHTSMDELKPEISTSEALSVSKQEVNFMKNGGLVIIDVNSIKSYEIINLPSWCKIKNKYNTWFLLECEANNGSKSRANWFNVISGDNEIRIDINQYGDIDSNIKNKSNQYEQRNRNKGTKFYLSTTDLFFSDMGGIQLIDIKGRALDYEIIDAPEWCRVRNKYLSWFSVICDKNNENEIRKGQLRVISDGKEVIIKVTQEGKSKSKAKSKPKTYIILDDIYSEEVNFDDYIRYNELTIR